MSKKLKTTKAIILIVLVSIFAAGSILVAIHYAPDETDNNEQTRTKVYNGFN